MGVMEPPTIIGMMRVRNEERWIGDSVSSMCAVCQCVHVLNDNSIDNTAKILHKLNKPSSDRIQVISSPFKGLDEQRDKNFLLGQILYWHAEFIDRGVEVWILHLDGDEVLAKPDEIVKSIQSGEADAYSLQVLYIWDKFDQVRVDARYSTFWRGSLFKASACTSGFRSTTHGKGANLHCGNLPANFIGNVVGRCDAKILHYGYMDRGDRLKNYEYYNHIDPNNEIEDRYRHMVIGDLPELPPETKTKWAGPLQVEPLEKWL